MLNVANISVGLTDMLVEQNIQQHFDKTVNGAHMLFIR